MKFFISLGLVFLFLQSSISYADSTKEKIISATIDEMERFSNAASRLINNVDSKLQTETKERIRFIHLIL